MVDVAEEISTEVEDVDHLDQTLVGVILLEEAKGQVQCQKAPVQDREMPRDLSECAS